MNNNAELMGHRGDLMEYKGDLMGYNGNLRAYGISLAYIADWWCQHVSTMAFWGYPI
jgi:hypothetical protein